MRLMNWEVKVSLEERCVKSMIMFKIYFYTVFPTTDYTSPSTVSTV
jgi:hypothetical protein